jgi:hypothetical protein
MAGAQAAGINPPPRQPIPLDREQRGRTLRWCYRRDGEVLTCALALTPDCSAYELRVSPPRPPLGPASETFDDAICAFQRHATLERALLGEGWMLEAFEHQVTDAGTGALQDVARRSA